MHASSLIVALLPLLALSTAQAHTITPPHMRHRRLANSVRHITDSEEIVPHALVAPRLNTGHAEAKKIIKKSVKKRGQQCRPRNPTTTSFSAAAATASSSSASDSSSSASDVNTLNNQAWAAHATSTYIAPTTTSSPAWAPTTTSSADWSQSTASSSASWSAPSASSGGSSSSGGVLSITDPTCGWCGANDDQPNGAIGWLNCGLDAGGWTPPHVTVDQLIAAELSSDGVFSPCASYIDKFNQYADQFGLKGIMLASFAMQESTCNPSATGGNGEAGLMQLAHENCHGAPGGK
ncbi:hypothetical protein CI109_106202 [Kwoniella shandongensis]|uniref:Transglycosylase SLT domain-containing protein n=1 Tax=Kwoniella shandongensis TaxID=1734106 RepID=A0AAJ8MZH4_9TREE